MQMLCLTPNGKHVSGRWVKSNKQDAKNPKWRVRYVAQEVGSGSDEALYAATPPLEARKVLLSQFARQRSRGGVAIHMFLMSGLHISMGCPVAECTFGYRQN